MNERELNERAAAVKDDVVAVKDRALEAAADMGERVQRGAHELGERARNYGTVGADYARRAGSSTASFAAENALPLSLIGLGVGWLVLSARRNRALMDDEFYDEFDNRTGHALTARAREATSQLATRVGDGYETARQRVGEVASQVGQHATQWTQDARQWTYDARDGLTQAGRRTVDYADENPLLVGALAIAAGVGVGLALPATRRENQLLGSTRDRLLGEARGVLDEARHTVRDTARDVQRQARETKEELRNTVNDPRFSH